MLDAVSPTAEQVLERVEFTWERLEKLAWKALGDRMRNRGISLDEDRRQRAFELYLEVGIEWAKRYDVALSRGVGFPASCYRRMYPRLTDFLRDEHGDSRRGTPLLQVPTAVMPDGLRMVEESFEQLVERVSGGLTTRALMTLQTVGFDMLVTGIDSSYELAKRHKVAAGDIDELLEELGWQLRSSLGRAA